MPKLHVLSGVLEGKTFDLLDERVTMGRALDNIIRMEDGTVSHHHATLNLDSGDYSLRDLNSTNGTRVNGIRIVETKLHNGDAIRLGSVELRYEADTKKASQPLPPAKTGVDFTQVGLGSGKPPTFSSVSPFGRRAGPKRNLLLYIVVGLGFAAAGVLALLVIKFFGLR